MKDITNKTKLTLLLIFWAIIFLIAGIGMAKSEDNSKMYGQYCSGEVDKIVVVKSEKKLSLLDECGNEIKSYKVRVGKNKGAKHCDGDKKTPEGTYHITEKRDSKYHKFLALDYPQAKDLKKAKELGCYVGDSIGIHYYNKEFAKTNDELYNSLGCITVYSKQELNEINKLVNIGTIVEIVP